MKKVLFYTFLAIFLIISIITLLGIIHVVQIDKNFLDKLFIGLIMEVVCAVLLLFKYAVLDPYEITKYKTFPSYKVVKEFFSNLQNRKYNEAYELMDNNCEQKKQSYQEFVDGFKNTKRIVLLSIQPYKATEPNSHDYIIYYVDEVMSPIVDELDDIHTNKVKDIVDIGNRIELLKERIEKAGFNSDIIDQLTVDQIVAPNSGDIIRFLLTKNDIDHRNSEHIFGEKKIVKFVHGRLVVVDKTNHDWKILSITPLEKG